MQVQAEASRLGINYVVAKITEKEDPTFRRIVNLLAGITGVAVRVDAGDMTKVFPIMVKEAPFSKIQVRRHIERAHFFSRVMLQS